MNGKKLVRGTILTALCMAAMLYMNSTVSEAYWVVVKSDNTRVRNTASTDSDVMTAVNAGDRLDVVSEEQGSDGNTWYKVSINNVSGYVRSDTVEKEAEGGTGANTAAETTAQAEPAASSSVASMPSQGATVKKDDVNVRESASTNGRKVATLSSGAAVTLTGTSTDSSGATWYQVNFINNGSNVIGFIREDFVELGEVVEATPETETPGEAENGDDELANLYGDMPTEAEAANNDYELFFEPDTEGVNCWYVHDNVARKKYKLEQLLQVEEKSAHNMEIKDKEAGRLKLAVIALAVLLVLALAAAGFFGFKYYGARVDDDDDDDDFVETPPVRKRTRAESETVRGRERDSKTVQRRPQAGEQRRPAAGGQKRPEAERRMPQRQPQTRRPESDGVRKQTSAGNGSARPASRAGAASSSTGSAPVRKTARTDVEWKSKNFLADDEDDYSFINMDEDV